MTTRTGYAPADGTALYYELTGSGPPIVLLHGFSFDHRMWDDQVAALASRHTVVRYDLRGFGRSAPAGVAYSHADDLAALLGHLGLDRVALLGLSLGGGAALNFAILHPGAVTALVVSAPTLGGFSWSAEIAATLVALRDTARQAGVEVARSAWRGHPLFAPARADADLAARLRALTDGYSGWHWLNADPGRPLQPPALARLGEIVAPTLVVVGEHDLADYHAIAATVAQAVPGARTVILPGAGHLANLEAPTRFNEAVLGFLDAHVAGEAGAA